MKPAQVKQILGFVLLIAFLISAVWKINDALGNRGDGGALMFFLFLVFLLIFLAVRRILRY